MGFDGFCTQPAFNHITIICLCTAVSTHGFLPFHTGTLLEQESIPQTWETQIGYWLIYAKIVLHTSLHLGLKRMRCFVPKNPRHLSIQVAWMHHNTLAEAGEIPSSEPMDIGHAWVPEMEIGEGRTHQWFTIFFSNLVGFTVSRFLEIQGLSDFYDSRNYLGRAITSNHN